MNWVRDFQRAIDYIEEKICEPLDCGRIAQEMKISEFYFRKIFTILCGFSVGEYIRNRRLALAGCDLISSDEKIIDIAMKYGYDTPEGFTRAFTAFHGASPSEVRKGTAQLRSFSRLSISVTMKGGSIMDYKIIKKDAFKVLEKVESHSIDNERNKNSIPDFWTRSHADGTINVLKERTPDKEFIFGICYGNTHEDSKTFDYSIAALWDGNEPPEGFRVNEIPAGTWAVFECIGAMPDAIQDMWHRIVTEFFPASGYIPTYAMDIEAYTDGEMTSEKYRSEIWVAVESK